MFTEGNIASMTWAILVSDVVILQKWVHCRHSCSFVVVAWSQARLQDREETIKKNTSFPSSPKKHYARMARGQSSNCLPINGAQESKCFFAWTSTTLSGDIAKRRSFWLKLVASLAVGLVWVPEEVDCSQAFELSLHPLVADGCGCKQGLTI